MKFKDTEHGDWSGKEYDGSIYLSSSGLTSLEGSPDKVTGNFFINDNKGLESLKGAPHEVTGSFSVSDCDLKSLEGGSTKTPIAPG